MTEHGCQKLTLTSYHGVTGYMCSVVSSRLYRLWLCSVTGIIDVTMRWTPRMDHPVVAIVVVTKPVQLYPPSPILAMCQNEVHANLNIYVS